MTGKTGRRVRLKDWTPSSFDSTANYSGEDLETWHDWYVLPYPMTRDTRDPLETSNWESVQAYLREQDIEYEILHFRHWACGWIEIIIVPPGMGEFIDKLGQVFNEEDYTARCKEHEDTCWHDYGRTDIARQLEKLITRQMTREDLSRPADERQRWCRNTGIAIDVCCCGGCFLTAGEQLEQLRDRIENATDRAWTEFRSMYVRFVGVGFQFSQPVTIDDLLKINWSKP